MNHIPSPPQSAQPGGRPSQCPIPIVAMEAAGLLLLWAIVIGATYVVGTILEDWLWR